LTPSAQVQERSCAIPGRCSSTALCEAYATGKPTQIVFVLEAKSAEEAASYLGRLPMIDAGIMTFRLIELRPFANWSLLFAS
jgi:hypothetical protein